MVNFGLLTAEICWRVWGTPANFNGFRVLAALLHGTLVVGVSQTAALNRGRHLYLAVRPSRWALAHILVDWWIGWSIDRFMGLYSLTLCDDANYYRSGLSYIMTNCLYLSQLISTRLYRGEMLLTTCTCVAAEAARWGIVARNQRSNWAGRLRKSTTVATTL